MDIKASLKQQALYVYFLFAFVITWGGILIIVALKKFNPGAITLTDALGMFAFMLLGPSLSSLSLTALLEGKEGMRNLFSRMGTWRLGWSRYLVLLIVPALSTGILAGLSIIVSPNYAPAFNPAFGLVVGLLAGFIEELGWTGFALPRLQAKHGVFVGGLILGLLWALWHGMADFWGNRFAFGQFWIPNFILYWILPLSAYRILISQMYNKTKSLLLAQLMHVFYSGVLATVEPGMTVTAGLLWKGIFAMALWCIVAATTLLQRRTTQT